MDKKLKWQSFEDATPITNEWCGRHFDRCNFLDAGCDFRALNVEGENNIFLKFMPKKNNWEVDVWWSEGRSYVIVKTIGELRQFLSLCKLKISESL